MAEHLAFLNAEVIAIIIGLIAAISPLTSATVLRFLRSWIIKGMSIGQKFLEISEDGKFDPKELEEFWETIRKAAEQDPAQAASFVKTIIRHDPSLADMVLNDHKK